MTEVTRVRRHFFKYPDLYGPGIRLKTKSLGESPRAFLFLCERISVVKSEANKKDDLLKSLRDHRTRFQVFYSVH